MDNIWPPERRKLLGLALLNLLTAGSRYRPTNNAKKFYFSMN